MALSTAVKACLLLAVGGAAHNKSEDPLLITLKQGQIRGVERHGSRIFRGIPYAAPPLGDSRWRPPQRHIGWKGVLNASDFGPSCMSPKCWNTEDVARRSEDCLTINVVTPKTKPKGQGLHAVMVYLHAGEFHCGSSNDLESRWPKWAKDIIFVSFNYRIGVFGFLAANELRYRDPRGGTGNYGMLDQRMALEWVHDNIAVFGGDASRVTIWGESSGGSSVAYHLVANGKRRTVLFQGAILQSPGLTQVKALRDAELNYEWVLAVLAARGSPNCPYGTGFVEFPSTEVAVGDSRAVLAVHAGDNVADAKAWCGRYAECMGFTVDRAAYTITYVSTNPAVQYASDKESMPDGQASTAFLKRGPDDKSDRISCLVSADGPLLDMLTEILPRDDTFQTDAWAPTIDSVYLNETLMESIKRGKIALGVNILIGTNLDEGTEFMFLTPPLECNASFADLKHWAKVFYGPYIGEEMPRLYQPNSLRRPLPACGVGSSPSDLPGERAVAYNAAMRSAGDAAIRCPSELLALRATGKTYMYMFTLTPKYSANFVNSTIMGAFHGAEVPYVFGDTFEVSNHQEAEVSKVMGCMWRSFGLHGDPGVEPCGVQPGWPPFSSLDLPVMNFGRLEVAVRFETLIDHRRCQLFSAEDDNDDDDSPRSVRTELTEETAKDDNTVFA